jgi:hypothetical protein
MDVDRTFQAMAIGPRTISNIFLDFIFVQSDADVTVEGGMSMKVEEKIMASGLFLMLIAILILMALHVQPSKVPEQPRHPAPSPVFRKNPAAVRNTVDRAVGRRGQAMIITMLKDPESAKFSGVIGRVKRGKWVACGYVNSRNSFGGMAGDQGWVAFATDGLAYIDSGWNNYVFVRNWNRYCTGDEDAVDTDISPMHIATREIKRRKLPCGKVTEAKDLPDGSVTATCPKHINYKVSYIAETDQYLTYEAQ